MSKPATQHRQEIIATLNDVTIIVPAKNEAATIGQLLDRIFSVATESEIIVVNDGSTDDTSTIAESKGAIVVNHKDSRGNGAAVKTGIRHASRKWIAILDADGQHPPEIIPDLLKQAEQGYDMVVGARGKKHQASLPRMMGNQIYNALAGAVVGKTIPDLTSGFRLARRDKLSEFIPLYPNGFSLPTTSTMAFFRAGYQVGFHPFDADQRIEGSASHIRLVKDGARFFLIIFRVGTLYSPLKIFLPISASIGVGGLAYSVYTLLEMGRFTNFGALSLSTALIVFLIGLLSEQVTNLMYLNARNR